MSSLNSTSSVLERWIIGLLDTVLLTVIVVIVAWLVWNNLLQIGFLLAAFALSLLLVLSAAAWRHGFRWFLSRRALRFYAWLCFGIISVIVLFYAEENWRGKRAWAALQREAAARGESLELSSIFPPPVTDEQNFVLAPGMPELFGPNKLPFYHGVRNKWPTSSAGWVFQQPVDLAAWQKFFRQHPITASTPTNDNISRLAFPVAPEPQSPAADVLTALSRYDSDLAVLRAANQRPKVRYPLAYEDGWFALDARRADPVDNIYPAAHILSLRAVAELAQDRSEAALKDTLLALRLANSMRQEPYERLHSTRAEMLMFCLQPVWEGLTSHRWNDAQLLTLQQRFADMDLMADFRLAARGETILTMNLADQLLAFLEGRRSPAADQMRSVTGDDLFAVWLFRLFYPTGWIYQDKVWIYRFYEKRADPFKDLATQDQRQSYAELHRATDPFLLIFVVPRLKETFWGSEKRALFLQTACQEAMVACALERYRLAQGQYPDTLGALVPTWLKRTPADLLDPKGSPLKYRREANGGFVLYSIGLNRVDDQGKAATPIKDWQGAQATFPKFDKDDWVWLQPGKP